MEKKYISERDVTKITGFALPTLRNHRSQGKGIPYLKIGKAVRYDYEAVIRFMEGHAIKTEQN